MRELPILYTTSNVQAILAGRKDMTRRAMKPQPPTGYDAPLLITETEWGFRKPSQGHMPFFAKPRYQVGDMLWCRESYYSTPDKKELLGYVADGDIPHGKAYRVRPSIFMFKHMARLWLEVTAVKAERLQEITMLDGLAEGYPAVAEGGDIILWFHNLWESINGKTHPWDSNPWVWAYSFKRIER